MGLKKAGFLELASIDFNPEAVLVFRSNFPEVPYVLEKDLKEFPPKKLAEMLSVDHVDLIVGGPPCQGFSTVRQVDGSNSGDRLVDDDRRELFYELLNYVEYFQPKIFIMENVPGIRSAVGGHFFTQVQMEARKLGYRVHGEIIRAADYGVPQKRRRQLIIGTQLDLPLFSGYLHLKTTHGNAEGLKPKVTLWEAIGDLPPLDAGSGEEQCDYDLERRKKHLQKYGSGYLIDVLEVDQANKITAHVARPHSERDLRDFKRLREGETSAHAISRGEQMEFPYDRSTFKDRYTRQHRDTQCSTIVAHLSKDGLMFIHPTQDRSLTPREAARIQSFPDWFLFPVKRSHQYRLIGNAVPPLVAKALGNAVIDWMDHFKIPINLEVTSIPGSEEEAVNWLLELVNAGQGDKGKISQIPDEIFVRGWYSIAFLFPYLHPDGAKENGNQKIEPYYLSSEMLKKVDPRLVDPIYARSGWPVALVSYAIEAKRRLEDGKLKLQDYYCSTTLSRSRNTKKEK